MKEVYMLNSKTKNQTKNQTETETKEWVLPNGYTYLAITATDYGSWSKAREPFTACRDVYRNFINSGYAPPNVKKVPVVLVYCHEETTKVLTCGGYQWDNNFPPIPVGLLAITRSSMKPATKNEFGGTNHSCDDWLKELYALTKPSVQNPFENA
jgi:hypothetical protein